MDWRLISAVTLASASFSVVAFGAYTLRAADAVPAGGNRAKSPPSLVAPSLVPPDRSGAVLTAVPERGVSFVPVASEGAAPATEKPAQTDMQVAALEDAPVLVADLPASQDRVARSSWRRRHHVTWRVGHHVRFCTALHPCVEQKQQVAVRHTEEHPAPKVALMVGVAF